MAESLLVVGAGGFGREVLDVVDAINAASTEPVWAVAGVVDDSPSDENLDLLAKRGVPFLGTSADAISRGSVTHYVVGIGSPQVRRKIAAVFDAGGLEAATLVHPDVTAGFDVTLGAGSVVCAGVRLTTNVHLGRHVHLNLNVTVGHDTTIDDFVSVNPLASVSGDCVVEEDVLIGVAGVILNGLIVGAGATVGGSACVVKNVTPGATVKGVPAR
ncbi:NeuD/PglB/VioB family sugar acetyltransferase [Nocardioides houyundeii]|uniref:NeuD/PglB/VioB family sugar acetyltransferase n=1 Tax=Nocardioides houyundeii TaxID=2045452 RepID=UPI000DF26210|nr:NeuD/PglB/VioB family sugar acetyltransferase [Nocardioides houyundeii]